jgi:hypothetical protein
VFEDRAKAIWFNAIWKLRFPDYQEVTIFSKGIYQKIRPFLGNTLLLP